MRMQYATGWLYNSHYLGYAYVFGFRMNEYQRIITKVSKSLNIPRGLRQ